MLKAMQQQFYWINMVLEKFRDRMDKQNTVIADLQRGQRQRVPNVRIQNRHIQSLGMNLMFKIKVVRMRMSKSW